MMLQLQPDKLWPAMGFLRVLNKHVGVNDVLALDSFLFRPEELFVVAEAVAFADDNDNDDAADDDELNGYDNIPDIADDELCSVSNIAESMRTISEQDIVVHVTDEAVGGTTDKIADDGVCFRFRCFCCVPSFSISMESCLALWCSVAMDILGSPLWCFALRSCMTLPLVMPSSNSQETMSLSATFLFYDAHVMPSVCLTIWGARGAQLG